MKKLSLAIALGLAAIGAQAATVSFQFGIPPVLANTEINVVGNLGLFNTNLGTLTDVELKLESAMAGTITLSLGNATGNTNVRGTATSDLFFTSTLAPLQAALGGGPQQTLSYTTGFINLAPNSATTVQNLSANASTTLNAALDAFIASFGAAGGGTFGMGCSTISGLGLTGGAGFSGGSETRQAGCGAQITYTYDPVRPPVVPEPGSIALVGLALAAAGLVTRRRQA